MTAPRAGGEGYCRYEAAQSQRWRLLGQFRVTVPVSQPVRRRREERESEESKG